MRSSLRCSSSGLLPALLAQDRGSRHLCEHLHKILLEIELLEALSADPRHHHTEHRLTDKQRDADHPLISQQVTELPI